MSKTMSKFEFAKSTEIFIRKLSSVQDRVKENMTKDMNVTETKEAMSDQTDGTGRGGCWLLNLTRGMRTINFCKTSIAVNQSIYYNFVVTAFSWRNKTRVHP